MSQHTPRYWRRWYFAVLLFLVIQIVAYALFTEYWK